MKGGKVVGVSGGALHEDPVGGPLVEHRVSDKCSHEC